MGVELPKGRTPGLPDPNKEEMESDASACASTNKEIDKETLANNKSIKKWQGSYHHYDNDRRANIGKYADIHDLRTFQKRLITAYPT